MLGALLLVTVLVSSVVFMNHFLCIPMTSNNIRVINMHKEPANSIDVLLIGSSSAYTSFASGYAYEKYGFTSYPYTIAGATCTMWKPALQDALRTQDPKLVVIDVFGGGYPSDQVKTRYSQACTVMTYSHLSKEKVETAKELSASIKGTSTLSYIFPFFRYHYRVPSNLRHLGARITLERSGPSPLKGLHSITLSKKFRKTDAASFSDASVSLDSDTELILRNFMHYCKSRNIKVLFVKYPVVLLKKYHEDMRVNLRTNRVLEIADEYGFNTLNLQKHFYDIGLDEKTDFYNHEHVNIYGQKKITAYLGDYIQNTLHIPPSELSGDLKKAWDESVVYYNAFYELNEEIIKSKTREDVWDCPDTVRKLTERIRK